MIKHAFFFLILALILSILYSCSDSRAFSRQGNNEPDIEANEHLVMATLYQQTAAEYRALCYQAFNAAQLRVDQASKTMGMKKLAVVVDIDETMLDNSPYQAYCILEYIRYPEGWEKWVNNKSAKAVPGALRFTKYAEKAGIEIFYVTNRKEIYRDKTLQNLIDLGFPFADNDHLLMRTTTSSKTERRKTVSQKFNIICLIGDNLNDFSEDFEKLSVDKRFAVTDRFSDEFGSGFIVLPNAMYGEWEGAVYNYDYAKSTEEKMLLRTSNLTSF